MGMMSEELRNALKGVGKVYEEGKKEVPTDSGLSLILKQDLVLLKFAGDLFGNKILGVAHEQTFNLFARPELNPRLLMAPSDFPAAMTHDRKDREPIFRYYNPAKMRNTEKPGVREFLFIPRYTRRGIKYERLMFERRMRRDDTAQPEKRMACARFGEENCFGFSVPKDPTDTKKRHFQYMPLAYPGRTPTFMPLFIKIENSPNDVYLKVTAVDVPYGVAVRSEVVDGKDAPPHLQAYSYIN